jgi:transposase
MAEPVRARRLTDQEGQKLQQIVRRGKHESIRVRRAMIIMASASGTTVPAIAHLVAAHEDTVRDVIHAFNERGLAALDPNWAGGRPRQITSDDEAFIVTAATTRPAKLGRPFTHWSIRKLADYLDNNTVRQVKIGRERLRQILRARGISLQRTRTGRSPLTPARTPSRTGSRRSPADSRTGVSPSTSSGRCRSGPATAPAGLKRPGPTGCRRPTTARTVSAISTAAIPSAMTSCGASTGNARAA